MKFIYKKTMFLLFLIIMFCSYSCIFGDYKDTLKAIPGDAHLIFNISLQPFLKRSVVMGEVEKLKEDEKVKKFFDQMEELALSIAFPGSEKGEIDLEKDLFPYINVNFSIAFYNMGSTITGQLFNNIKEEKPDFLIIFDIKDNIGIDMFLKKLEKTAHPFIDYYGDQLIYKTKESFYFSNNEFLVISSNMDLIRNSIDCNKNKAISIIKNNNFSAFREHKMNSEAIGFLYWNVPALKAEFLNSVPDVKKANWKGLLDSIEFIGTSIELDRNKLNFNSFIIKGKNLSPIGEEFFSIGLKKLKSLDFYPEEVSVLIAISDGQKFLKTFFSLGEKCSSLDFTSITEKIKKMSGLSLEDFFSSISGETGLGFFSNEYNSEKDVSGNWMIALDMKDSSWMNKVFQNSEYFLSLLVKTENYRGVNIRSIFDITYSRLDKFLLLSFSKNNEVLKSLIDTYNKDEDSIGERMNSEISFNSSGIIYLNINDIYKKYLKFLVKDESFKDKLESFFEHYPEIWGSITSNDEGYVSTLVMPF